MKTGTNKKLKIYPYNKLKSLYFLILNDYYWNSYKEGWMIITNNNMNHLCTNLITDGFIFTIYPAIKKDENQIPCGYYCINEAVANAERHGIIFNEHNIIIDFDKEIFNESLYLWQAQDLGIL